MMDPGYPFDDADANEGRETNFVLLLLFLVPSNFFVVCLFFFKFSLISIS